MLHDESLHALDHLAFAPGTIMPDSGALFCGVMDATSYLDTYLNRELLSNLDGVLIAGLFEETGDEFHFPAVEWSVQQRFRASHRVDISDRSGDLLAFGLEIRHRGQMICRAGECDNWALVWTPRTADRFELTLCLRTSVKKSLSLAEITPLNCVSINLKIYRSRETQCLLQHCSGSTEKSA